MSVCTRPIVAAKSAVSMPDDRDDLQGDGSAAENRRAARDHVHAGRHHGGGVNQRADRRRTFHGVRQPDIERDLGALAGGSDEQQQPDGGQDTNARLPPENVPGRRRSGGRPRRNSMRPEGHEDQEYAEHKADIADPVDDECLFAGVPGAAPVEVVADQQVGAEPHAFPADKHQQEVAGQHQDQHREQEQVQVGEEPIVPVFGMHVADGIDVDQKSDAGDHQQHDRRQRVQEKLNPGHEVPGGDPGEQDC